MAQTDKTFSLAFNFVETLYIHLIINDILSLFKHYILSSLVQDKWQFLLKP